MKQPKDLEIDIPGWVENRILHFLNQARAPEDIAGDGQPDAGTPEDPDNWDGYSIGATVAQRIIDKRNTLAFNRFRTAGELNGISGFGQDKFDDLVRVFELHAAEAFRRSMYQNNLIFESNWKLTNFTTFIPNAEEYRHISRSTDNLRQFVAEQVEAACLDTFGDSPTHDQQLACRLLGKSARAAYVDTYSNSAQASDYAFALWWYQFDADNWFSFERVREECSGYFSYHAGGIWEMKLHLFKGFSHEYLSDGIVPDSLPVVTSEAEQSITLWTSALYD